MSSLRAVCFLCVVVQGSLPDDKMSPLRHLDDDNNSTLAFVTWIDESEKYLLCQEFIELVLIRESISPPGIEISHPISKEQVQSMMQECSSLKRKKRQTTEESDSNNELIEAAYNYDTIYPGTKWCGAGSIAKNDSDLGTEADTDRCCRSHDMCDDFILAGETGHGLKNNERYTALNCRCDNALNDCLSKVDTATSNTVGNLYFNTFRSRCFKKDYPQTSKCKTFATRLDLRCVEYEEDTTKPKVYQWFPASVYKKLPFIDKVN